MKTPPRWFFLLGNWLLFAGWGIGAPATIGGWVALIGAASVVTGVILLKWERPV